MKTPIQQRFTLLLVKRLLKNEKAFTYPVTLCFLILFTLFLSFHFTEFVMEKKFYEEVVQYEKNNYYFLLALKETERHLQDAGEEYERIGEIVYKDGTVFYSIVEAENNLLKITFSLNRPSRTEVNGLGYYHKQLQRMVNWFEKG